MANLSMSNAMTYKAHRPKSRMNVPGTSLKGGLGTITVEMGVLTRVANFWVLLNFYRTL